MASPSFLTSHARVLLCIARDPGVRLRDIAASPGITERSACGIVTGLTAVGYVVKQKDGRRNRYQIQAHLPLPDPPARNPPSAKSWPSWPEPARGRNGGLPGPMADLARFLQLPRGTGPGRAGDPEPGSDGAGDVLPSTSRDRAAEIALGRPRAATGRT